jgi:pimeloyl-ACP methyl ester carboxylesterase
VVGTGRGLRVIATYNAPMHEAPDSDAPIGGAIPVATPDGRRLDVFIGGPADGDALLYHSGTPGAPIPFAPAVREMARRGLRYVAFSRPGYGSSTRRAGRSVADVADDARTVLDHIGAGRAYVIGHSGGGPHALACAALLPERVRAVATIGGVAPWGADGLDFLDGMGAENVEEFNAALEGPEALIGFKERNWPTLRAVTAEDVAASLGDLVDEVDRGSLTGEFAEHMAATMREALRESYWGWFDDDMAFARPWGFELTAISAPVHIWQGRHDRMVPYAHGEWLAAHVGVAVPHLFEEHGHLSLVVDSMGAILDALVAPDR